MVNVFIRETDHLRGEVGKVTWHSHAVTIERLAVEVDGRAIIAHQAENQSLERSRMRDIKGAPKINRRIASAGRTEANDGGHGLNAVVQIVAQGSGGGTGPTVGRAIIVAQVAPRCSEVLTQVVIF